MGAAGAAPLHQPCIRATREGRIRCGLRPISLPFHYLWRRLGVAQAQRILGPMSTEPAPMRPPVAAVPTLCPPPPLLPRPAPGLHQSERPRRIARTVEIDTTGGPGLRLRTFQDCTDFLRPGEVVLTFDDGPWPTTPIVLDALARRMRQGYLLLGRHNAMAYPDILKQVAAAGHTIGSHTWIAPGPDPRRCAAASAKSRLRSQGRDRKGHERRARLRSGDSGHQHRSSAFRSSSSRRS